MVSIEPLKKICKPRVHGNGFIQLDLGSNPDRRLHIWGHPAIPKQRVSTELHNHRFSYKSTILVGDIVHETYDLHKPNVEAGEGYDYGIYECRAAEGEDTKLVHTGRYTCAHLVTERAYIQGDVYGHSAGLYHRVVPIEPSATLMTKTEVFDLKPTVLVPRTQRPDNDFDRNSFDEEELWDIVEEVLSRVENPSSGTLW